MSTITFGPEPPVLKAPINQFRVVFYDHWEMDYGHIDEKTLEEAQRWVTQGDTDYSRKSGHSVTVYDHAGTQVASSLQCTDDTKIPQQ